jgi:hypothetical protein
MTCPISRSPARIPEKLPPGSSSIPPPRRVGFVAPKLTFRVRRTAAPIVDFIEISQMSSFRQNGGWRALRSSCRSNRRRCCDACIADYYRTICMFVNDLEAAGLVVTTGRRARRHRARNPQIALPRMGQLVVSAVPRVAADCMGFFNSAMGQGTKSLRDSGGEAWLERINQVRDRR